MNTTDTTTSAMTTAQLASLVLDHLAEHRLPDPGVLLLETYAYGGAMARIQLAGLEHDLPSVAGALLAWANTFTSVTVTAWRPPTGTAVHLDLDTMLSGPHGGAAVTVYAGTSCDPAVFGPIQPNERRPVTLGQLATWAGGAA